MSTPGLAQAGLASLTNGPIDLESEVSRSNSKASSRPRSTVEQETASACGEDSSRKEKENLERLLNIFNGGHGLDLGVRYLALDARKPDFFGCE